MKIRVYQLFATLFLALGLQTANAQFNQTLRPENSALVKIYPAILSPIPRSGFGASVEFKVGDAASLQANGILGLGYKDKNQTVQSYYFGAEMRYYFNKFDVFNGFFAGGHIGSNAVSFSDGATNSSGRHFSFPVGLIAGYQYRITDHLYLEGYLAPALAFGSKFELGFGNTSDFNYKPYEGLNVRAGLGVAYGF